MKEFKTKILVVSLLAAIALMWGVTNYVPSIIEAGEGQCASPRVVDDLSKELLICYDNVDRCNRYFEACVNVYLQQNPEGEIKP